MVTLFFLFAHISKVNIFTLIGYNYSDIKIRLSRCLNQAVESRNARIKSSIVRGIKEVLGPSCPLTLCDRL